MFLSWRSWIRVIVRCKWSKWRTIAQFDSKQAGRIKKLPCYWYNHVTKSCIKFRQFDAVEAEDCARSNQGLLHIRNNRTGDKKEMSFCTASKDAGYWQTPKQFSGVTSIVQSRVTMKQVTYSNRSIKISLHSIKIFMEQREYYCTLIQSTKQAGRIKNLPCYWYNHVTESCIKFKQFDTIEAEYCASWNQELHMWSSWIRTVN